MFQTKHTGYFSYPFFRSFEKQHAIPKHIYQNVAIDLMPVKMQTFWFDCEDESEDQFQEIQRALWCTKRRLELASYSLQGEAILAIFQDFGDVIKGTQKSLCPKKRSPSVQGGYGFLRPTLLSSSGAKPLHQSGHTDIHRVNSHLLTAKICRDLQGSQRFAKFARYFVIRNGKLLPIYEPNTLGVDSM